MVNRRKSPDEVAMGLSEDDCVDLGTFSPEAVKILINQQDERISMLEIAICDVVTELGRRSSILNKSEDLLAWVKSMTEVPPLP